MALQMGIVCLALLGLSTALVCPDGGMCEDKNTCCKNTEGGYGCCPLPRAECCSDHLHCCYEGTLCDLVHKTCVNKTVSLPWMTRLPTKQGLLIPQLSERVKAVICPDQESECPDDTTCCQLPDSSWGCCPLAKAVCCEDKRHCCPEGTKCDLAHSKCVSASMGSFPMLEKLPARKRGNNAGLGSVPCPGGKISCPDGSTCCLSPSGSYNCCPFPEAVCCSDHIHCCPSNTTCDMTLEICTSGETHVPMMKKIPALPNNSLHVSAAPTVGSVLCPDGKTNCPKDTSCCPSKKGDYNCCFYPDAVCCSDHIHCCPSNTTCDMTLEICRSDQMHVPLMKKVPALPNNSLHVSVAPTVGSVPCPDGKTSCPKDTSCCPSKKGDYNCCFYPDAVCCSDNIHCCPSNTTCDMTLEICRSDQIHVPLMKKIPAIPNDSLHVSAAPTVGSVLCPDGKTNCPKDTSCCPSKKGDYNCCFYPDAVCCSDHIHCCPSNTTCDMTLEICRSDQMHVPLMKKVPALPNNSLHVSVAPTVGSVPCPDGKTSCPKDTSCCPSKKGDYNCCFYPDAVCCSDNIHCCPSNTTCDMTLEICRSDQIHVPLMKKIPAIPNDSLGSVPCPGGKISCPDGSTCCLSPSGSYNCCPLPEAVCCSDHIHCCPSNTTCDMTLEICTSGETHVPMMKKIPALPNNSLHVSAAPTVGSVLCPDGKTNCPKDTSCCPSKKGDYNCCFYPDAVCCSDHIHCCPSNTTCDMTLEICRSDQMHVPLMKKVPALPNNSLHVSVAPTVGSVPCPDGKTSCPKDTSCCPSKKGDYNCCFYPDAVCCSDNIHCCPSNTTCDMTLEICRSDQIHVPLMKKIPAIPNDSLGSVPCPGGKISCPDGSTCCLSPSGSYNCCPLPEAVCCSDHIHCCPSNTTCDMTLEICTSGETHVPMMKKIPALPNNSLHVSAAPTVGSVLCPDGKTNCPKDTSCCPSKKGDYNCCFYPDAVCCSDHIHCCPSNTTCDMTLEICRSDQMHVPLMQKVPALPNNSLHVSVAPTVGSVLCPDGKTSCPKDTSCCPSKKGDYNCCFYPDAVCCSDNIHCCPSNTTCDMTLEICRSDQMHVPLMKKIPAIPNDIDCPDKKSACPDETTCCQMANSSYGCCPMPNAVCCSDHIHCCPEGTTCDLQHSTCATAQGDVTLASEIPTAVTELVAAQSKVGAVPCNDSVACADGDTCCKSPEGQWACCPLPKAVCCEDHLHCCPHGTVCNLAASTCDDPTGSAVMPWLSKVPVFSLLTDNSKCDRSTSCPGKSTCCKTASGGWACCPLPQAVCCDDHVHCCPHGTVCNLEAETCDDPAGFSPSLPWMEKVSALTSEVQDEKCDRETMCPGGTTCCKKNSGQWACCPLPQAVCCSDREHCCPKGYKCNVAEQTCEQPGHLSVPWLQKIPALQREPVSSPARPARNMCDAQTSCPKDTTCCFMDRTHKWGCCPLPKAVCCKDGNHCCPSGHTCEPHRSSCSKGPHVIPWFTKVSALTEPGAVTDVKCDDKSSCASGTTCCKLPTGEWGCCPLVKAVCCADHEHCCPQGYTCNMQTGTCEKKKRDALVHVLPQSTVVRSEPRDTEEDADVPCDSTGEFRCSKQDTCCKVSATEWACCPTPGATCCPDSKHCCPAGYSCDLTAGGCTLTAQLTWDTLLGDRKRDLVPRGL
ncbi:granulin b isoform X2 [Trachinotus anak]|uniref:granulin b isoform X2 n=1 Tax=Trachinotus anak TaxID=443729 RepID=UPI0039F1DB0F